MASFAIAGPPASLQSQVKGLLVIELGNGSHAGTASQMNATAIPTLLGGFSVRFNQKVGTQMASATEEVEKFIRVRHSKNLPTGHTIELGFADKHSPKDGPSAAVACALMVDALITGKPLDPSFAITGDMTATGDVRPVGGVMAKIRGASRKKATLLSIPKGNRSTISDLYVLEGVQAVAKLQIFAVENFDQALAIAKKDKSEDIQAALADFALVQKAVKKKASLARHPKVVAKLKKVLAAIPYHESARIVALHSQKRGPKQLSLAGSFDAISVSSDLLLEALDDGSWLKNGPDDPLWIATKKMNRIKNSVDKRTRPYLSAFLSTAEFFKRYRDRETLPNYLREELKGYVRQINAERKKLINDKDIQEELMAEE